MTLDSGKPYTLLPLSPAEILVSQRKIQMEKKQYEIKNGLAKEKGSEGKNGREFGKSKSGEDEKQTESGVVRETKVSERIKLKNPREKSQGREKKDTLSIQPGRSGLVEVRKSSYPLLMFRNLELTYTPTEFLSPSILSVLQYYNEVFRDELPDGLPPIRGIEHQIDFIPGSSILNKPAYKTNPTEEKELQRQVDGLLVKGKVRESLSPCAVPVILVPKKTGDWRMCTDCRAVNKITIRYSHLMSLKSITKILLILCVF